VNKQLRMNEKGFGLIEALISLFLLVFFVFIVIDVFPYSVKAVKKSKNVLLATQVARKELEYAKQLPWSDLTTGSSYLQNRSTILTTTIQGISSTSSFQSFFTVTPLAEEPDNIKVVKVVVRWDLNQAGQGDEKKKVELEVLVSKDA